MKSSTMIMLVGGLGIVGVGGFLYFRNRNAGIPQIAGPGSNLPAINPALLQQPQQLYPVTPVQMVRQDVNAPSNPNYASQPVPKTNVNQMVDTNLMANVQLAQGASSIVKSLGSLWDDLGSFWGPDEIDASITEDDPFSGWSWGNLA